MTPSEMFWRHVSKGDGCWLWGGAAYPVSGYGRVRVGSGCVAAHRRAWTLTNGDIPAGLLVCHKCDVPKCVRPDHLFLGTYADNVHDCMAKGRRADLKGVRHPGAKLCDADVLRIRARHAAGERQTAIASDYGVTNQTVCYIVNGQTWSHL